MNAKNIIVLLVIMLVSLAFIPATFDLMYDVGHDPYNLPIDSPYAGLGYNATINDSFIAFGSGNEFFFAGGAESFNTTVIFTVTTVTAYLRRYGSNATARVYAFLYEAVGGITTNVPPNMGYDGDLFSLGSGSILFSTVATDAFGNCTFTLTPSVVLDITKNYAIAICSDIRPFATHNVTIGTRAVGTYAGFGSVMATGSSWALQATEDMLFSVSGTYVSGYTPTQVPNSLLVWMTVMGAVVAVLILSYVVVAVKQRMDEIS